MEHILDLADTIQQQVREWVDENMQPMTSEDAQKAGLDRRAVYAVYYNKDCFAVQGDNSKKSLEYYGGFEYVAEEFRRELGEFTIYLRKDVDDVEESRIAGHLDRLFDVEEDEQEED